MRYNVIADIVTIFCLKVVHMPKKPLPIDINDLIQRYRSGMTTKDLASQLGVKIHRISKALRSAGILLRGDSIRGASREEIVKLYMSGESVNALAKRFLCARRSIELRLRAARVELRSASEAEKIKWARMTNDERRRQVEAAHTAARIPSPFQVMCQRAYLRQQSVPSVSYLEDFFNELLTARGVRMQRQMAVGPYNADFATYPVAVEIFGGNWHFSGNHAARLEKRVGYFFDRGWHILALWHINRKPITADTADYVIAYMNELRRDPSRRPEYRVIRGASELAAHCRADDGQWALIPALRSVRDPTTGRYKSVPG